MGFFEGKYFCQVVQISTGVVGIGPMPGAPALLLGTL